MQRKLRVNRNFKTVYLGDEIKYLQKKRIFFSGKEIQTKFKFLGVKKEPILNSIQSLSPRLDHDARGDMKRNL